jgi:hypothetical protein
MSPSKLFSADMTKLIAGDSYLTPIAMRAQIDVLSDPTAEESFEVLTTLLANPAMLYFKVPENFPRNPRPLMRLWNKYAVELPPQKPSSQTATIHVEGKNQYERCSDALPSFLDLTKSDSNCHRLIELARFQFSYPHLMEVFWKNNSELELEAARENLRARLEKLEVFRAAFEENPVSIDEYSENVLVKSWSDFELTISWVFWNFVKGFTYASSLNGKHIYAVHWLREEALKRRNETVAIQDRHEFQKLFPWGPLLLKLSESKKFRYDEDAFTVFIENLRSYTRHMPVDRLDQIPDFALSGLRAHLSKELYPRLDFDEVLATLGMEFLAALAASFAFIAWGVSPEHTQSVLGPFKELPVKAWQLGDKGSACEPLVDVLKYDRTLKRVIKENEREFAQYWKANRPLAEDSKSINHATD